MTQITKNLLVFFIAGLYLITCRGGGEANTAMDPSDIASLQKLIGQADYETILEAIAEKKGKVVLLNMWATWCDPCVEEFPDIVMLYNKYKDQGLDVVTVSHDFDESFADSFLIAQNADFTNYMKEIAQDGNDFIIGIDNDWYGALPATWLFDRDGNRQYFVEEQFYTDKLEAKIVELLKK